MENKNLEVRFVLEMVIGDYLGVLADAEEDEFTPEQFDKFVDGLFEIGKVFDINIYDFDKAMIYPLLPQPRKRVMAKVTVSDIIMIPENASQEDLWKAMEEHLKQPNWPVFKVEYEDIEKEKKEEE